MAIYHYGQNTNTFNNRKRQGHALLSLPERNLVEVEERSEDVVARELEAQVVAEDAARQEPEHQGQEHREEQPLL